MRCDSVRDLLAEFLDGTLDHREALLVGKHLERCPACADDLADLKHSIQLCASLGEVDLPPDFRPKLRARLLELVAEQQPVRSGLVTLLRRRFAQASLRWGMAAAAAALALVLAYNGFSWPGRQVPMVEVSQDTSMWPNLYALKIEGGQAPEQDKSSPEKPGLKEKPTWIIMKSRKENRKLIKTGTVDLEAGNAREALDQIARMAEELDGHIEVSDPANGNGGEPGPIVLRLPSDAFDQMLAQIAKAGVVRDQVLNAQDVTDAYIEAEIRLWFLRAREKWLVELLGQSHSFSQVLALEQELGKIREAIQPLSDQLAFFDEAASTSAITINLVR